MYEYCVNCKDEMFWILKNIFHILFIFALRRKDMEINGLSSKLEDEQNLVAQLQKKIKELQVIMLPLLFCTYSHHYFVSAAAKITRFFLKVSPREKKKNKKQERTTATSCASKRKQTNFTLLWSRKRSLLSPTTNVQGAWFKVWNIRFIYI